MAAILLVVFATFRIQLATSVTALGARIMCGVTGGVNCTPAGTTGGGAGTAGGTPTNPRAGLVTTTGAGAGTGPGTGGLPPGAVPISTGLSGHLDTLINRSPRFNQLITNLQQRG